MLAPSILLRVGVTLITTLLILLTWRSITFYSSSSQPPSSLWTQYLPSYPSSSSSSSQIAQPLHDTSNILLILKTGASVISSRLPPHINTTLPIAQNLLLLSSLNQNFSGYPVHDVLANVSLPIKQTHKDFAVYRKLQQLDPEDTEGLEKLASGKAWDLDKWKFMPMLFEAYQRAGKEVEWFVMMEADTSLSWTNLVWWLGTMDSRKPRYLGAPNYCVGEPCNGQLFAHGGSGIVWSRSAVEKVLQLRESEGVETYDKRWEDVTGATCCGDIVLAEAFEEAGIVMTKAGPMIQGPSLDSYIWSDKDWCRPPITWHHVSPEEVEEIHEFSERWAREQPKSVPYLFSDVYSEFFLGKRRADREFWDNKSRTPGNGTDKVACKESCERNKSCVQWMFAEADDGTSCLFGEHFTIGKGLEGEDSVKGTNGNWTSGWVQEKVEKLVKNFGPC